jgi:hypothetical protein
VDKNNKHQVLKVVEYTPVLSHKNVINCLFLKNGRHVFSFSLKYLLKKNNRITVLGEITVIEIVQRCSVFLVSMIIIQLNPMSN